MKFKKTWFPYFANSIGHGGANGEKITNTLQKIYHYFAFMTISPIPSVLRQKKTGRRENWEKFIMWSLYLFTRIITIINLIHPIYTILDNFFSFGQASSSVVVGFDPFVVLDSIMWITVLVPIVWQDLFMLSHNFTVSFCNLMKLCEQIWQRVAQRVRNDEERGEMRHTKNFKVMSLFLYSR